MSIFYSEAQFTVRHGYRPSAFWRSRGNYRGICKVEARKLVRRYWANSSDKMLNPKPSLNHLPDCSGRSLATSGLTKTVSTSWCEEVMQSRALLRTDLAIQFLLLNARL